MPDIRKISDGTVEGDKGFIITWEMPGFTEQGAKFRARASTAMRFPTTATRTKITSVQEFGERDFNVNVFVPTDGFLSAGIQDPVEWLQENFGNILDL